MDLYEADCEPLLILLKKEDGQQWGMGIGKRPRGILITSLQPGSSADEKLKVFFKNDCLNVVKTICKF
jgi:hypothetical protein